MRLRQWEDGSPVRVFVLPDNNSIHIQFTKQILGVFPHQLRRGWDRRVFSGTGQAPESAETVEVMHRQISQTPGAIGYLYREESGDNVRVHEIR